MTREIKKVDFENNHSLQIEVVHLSGLIKKHSNALTIPHRTNFYHIFLFENCSPTHIVDFTPIKIKPHSLLFINKDNVHLFDKSSRYDGKVLIFTDEFFCVTEADRKFLHNTNLFNNLLSTSTIQIKKSNKKFERLFYLIEKELENKPDKNQYNILKNLLHILLMYAERVKGTHGFTRLKKGADLDYTILFKDVLDEKFHLLKSVKEYSCLLHVSEKRLNQATKKILGKTPKQMIDDRIVLEAKRLLIHTHQNIKEISFALGFAEPTNFIKYFRKHVSKTPVEFRESYSL